MFYSLPVVAFTLTVCLPFCFFFFCHSLAALCVVPLDSLLAFAVLIILRRVTALTQKILSLTNYTVAFYFMR